MVTVGAPAITIEVRVDGTTDNPVLPLTLPDAAAIVVDPGVKAVANPPAAIVATAVFDDDQEAVAVKFCVELSL